MNKPWIIIIWGLFIVVSGAAFPIYNLGKSHTYVLTGINLYLNIACYIELGIFEKKLLRTWSVKQAAIATLIVIISGMLFRYFLEFGEISNTYNFTAENALIHIILTFAISMSSFLLSKR